MPFPLEFLLAKDRLLVNAEMARRVFDYLHACGFRDDATPDIPVELVDYFGQPVSLASA